MPHFTENFNPIPRGRRGFPWKDWLGAIRNGTNLAMGLGFKLTEGIDFKCTRRSMGRSIRREAFKAGFYVSVRQEVDGLVAFFTRTVDGPITQDGHLDVPLRSLHASGRTKTPVPRHKRATRAPRPKVPGRGKRLRRTTESLRRHSA